MADRAIFGSYYDQQAAAAAAAAATAAMQHYAPHQAYRSGYAGYGGAAGYGYAAQPYGHSTAGYMHNYYGTQYDSSSGGGGGGGSSSAYRRYASYASPHYSQPSHYQQAHQAGMFTPAGQQLIPSSVLHYPPRHTPSPHAHPYAQARAAAAAAYQASLYGNSPTPPTHCTAAMPPQRSSTPAPNRTVMPPSYLEAQAPLRSYAEQLPLPALRDAAAENALEPSKAELDIEAASPQRLTTSPPLTSATGTDSGISNCSTRARSDSSQSTPVYSSEYPVNMSVESASCVSYHCPGDGKEFEEEQRSEVEAEADAADASAKTTAVAAPLPARQPENADDISTTTATPVTLTSPPTSTAPSDKQVSTAPRALTAIAEHVVEHTENNLVQPKEEQPQHADEQQAQEQEQQQQTQAAQQTNQIKEELGALGEQLTAETTACQEENSWQAQQQQQLQQQQEQLSWSPSASKRRSRTPPVPQNSPVGYGLAAAVPLSLCMLQQQQQQQQQEPTPAVHKTNSSNKSSKQAAAKSRNRIIECDLIPSKKSKRKSHKATSEAHAEPVEATVRQQIKDIKPLPGFQQAFGSTEIGRFSETFLKSAEVALEQQRNSSQIDEYAAGMYNYYGQGGGYYDSIYNMPAYWSQYDEHNNNGYNGGGNNNNNNYNNYSSYNNSYNNSSSSSSSNNNMYGHMQHNRMRGQSLHNFSDYMAYERYAAYGARTRARYGEISCNGY